MKPIGDFLSEALLRQKGVGSLPAPTSDQPLHAEPNALAVLQEVVSPDAALRLVAMLEQYAASTDFAEAVNQAVPPPQPEELEDQFVQRAKDAIRDQLLAKFG